MIKVVLMDDEAFARKGMCLVLEETPDIRVVVESRVSRSALKVVADRRPDVVLIGLGPEMALGLVGELTSRYAGTRVIVLTSAPTDHFVYEVISAGASALLLREADAWELVYAVRKVADGYAVIDPAIASRLFVRLRSLGQAIRGSDIAALRDLSPRERDVLSGIAAGQSNQEIARNIQVSIATVKSHVSHILAKLGVRDRLEAALLSVRCAEIALTPAQRPENRRSVEFTTRWLTANPSSGAHDRGRYHRSLGEAAGDGQGTAGVPLDLATRGQRDGARSDQVHLLDSKVVRSADGLPDDSGQLDRIYCASVVIGGH